MPHLPDRLPSALSHGLPSHLSPHYLPQHHHLPLSRLPPSLSQLSLPFLLLLLPTRHVPSPVHWPLPHPCPLSLSHHSLWSRWGSLPALRLPLCPMQWLLLLLLVLPVRLPLLVRSVPTRVSRGSLPRCVDTYLLALPACLLVLHIGSDLLVLHPSLSPAALLSPPARAAQHGGNLCVRVQRRHLPGYQDVPPVQEPVPDLLPDCLFLPVLPQPDFLPFQLHLLPRVPFLRLPFAHDCCTPHMCLLLGLDGRLPALRQQLYLPVL